MQKMLLSLNVAAALLCPLSALAQPEMSASAPLGAAKPISTLSTLPETLTLSAALAYAMQANPELAAAKREIQANHGARRQAGLWPNPELAAVIENPGNHQRSTTLQINQTLELGGKRPARVALAERNLAIAKNELAIKTAEIRAAVTTHFYASLIAQERQRVAQSSLELAQRASHAAQRQVALGKLAPLEATRAHIAESGGRVELAQANSEWQLAKQKLASSLGGKLAFATTLQGQFDTLPMLPSLAQLDASLPNSPLMRRAQLEYEKRMAMSSIEKSRQIPDVTLSIGAKREPQNGRQQAIVGLSVPLALFDRNQGNLQEAHSRVDKARDELLATQQRLQSELLQAQQRSSIAREEAQMLKKDVLPNAQHALELAIKGFEYGKFTFLDVLDAQRSLLQATSQYLRSLSEAQRASAELDSYLGDSAQALTSTSF